jgi:hypothetical protein
MPAPERPGLAIGTVAEFIRRVAPTPETLARPHELVGGVLNAAIKRRPQMRKDRSDGNPSSDPT